MKPVLVIGAGPVGMTMASELARYGVPVRIIDKAAQRTDKSKALVLWSRTLELLDRGGGSDPFVNAGCKAVAVNFIAGDKAIGRVSMENVQSPFPYALMLPQSETERLLEERLSRLGVRVERQVELTAFKSDVDGVQAVLRHGDGQEETVSTDWLLGCDGAHSIVRHGVGAPFTGETMNSDWILADVHMTGYPCSDAEASVYWHRDGVFVIFPISPGRYRVLADLPATGAEHPPTPTLEQAQAVIDRRGPGGLKAFDPIWLAGFRINGRKVSSYRWGRVFLSGDAAHVHSPAGGQGMNTGMQDAFNLAWKLALVVHKKCGEQLLESYSPERSFVGDEVLKAAGRLTAIGTMRNPVAQSVRNFVGHVMLGLSPFQHAFADTMTEITIGYPKSPLNGPSLNGTGPKPGARVVPVAGQAPVGSGNTPLFALFAQKTQATVDLVSKFAGLIDPNIRPPIHAGQICLVRPDGYVACCASDGDAVALYLAGLVQPSVQS
ncbi:MAG TPA: FAD-dependent monooxygenase [Phycisphaerae bacterium]|nr:FAD-dependent monooxygenase [Phycisphaerae bacterium]